MHENVRRCRLEMRHSEDPNATILLPGLFSPRMDALVTGLYPNFINRRPGLTGQTEDRYRNSDCASLRGVCLDWRLMKCEIAIAMISPKVTSMLRS